MVTTILHDSQIYAIKRTSSERFENLGVLYKMNFPDNFKNPRFARIFANRILEKRSSEIKGALFCTGKRRRRIEEALSKSYLLYLHHILLFYLLGLEKQFKKAQRLKYGTSAKPSVAF